MTWQPSRLTLGTVQFGLAYGIANPEGKPPFERVCALLTAALAGGVDTLDTAAAYGDSETVLGRALRATSARDRFRVVTKIPPLAPDEKDPDGMIERSLAGSLERLGLSRVAAILFHSEDDWPHGPRLQKLVDRGLAGMAGVSLDSPAHLDRVGDLPVVQLPVNAVDRRFEGFLDAAARRGTLVFARSAYLQGALTMAPATMPWYLAELGPVVERLAAVAADAGLDLRELCFRYVLTRVGVSSLVFGVDTPAQLAENLRFAAPGPLPAAVMDAVRAAVPELPERVVRPCIWDDLRHLPPPA